MTTLQIRIKDDTKKQAKKVLDTLGLDMSGAITLFLHQVILRKGIPFPIVTENGFTPAFEAEVLKAEKEKDQSPTFTDAKSALSYLHKEAGKLSKKK